MNSHGYYFRYKLTNIVSGIVVSQQYDLLGLYLFVQMRGVNVHDHARYKKSKRGKNNIFDERRTLYCRLGRRFGRNCVSGSLYKHYLYCAYDPSVII